MLNISTTLTAKRLALLRELVAAATLIAVLRNPASPDATGQLNEIEDAARTLGQQFEIVEASSERDFESVFATIAQLHAFKFQTNCSRSPTRSLNKFNVPSVAHLAALAQVGYSHSSTVRSGR